MNFLADRMAGAMAERVAKARLLDHGAGGLIDLPALERATLGKRGAHGRNRRIPAPRDHVKHVRDPWRHRAAGKGDPGQIAVDRARLIAFGPQIDEHETFLSHYRVPAGDRLVVRIAAV